MKEKWSDLEGLPVRFDVGSTAEESKSDKIAANVICFTTDNRIIFNGEEFTQVISSGGSVTKEYVDEKIQDIQNQLTQLIQLLTLSN